MSDDRRVVSDDDRTVHGLSADGSKVVRYDRAGKWYLEPEDGSPRILLSLRVAAGIVAAGRIYLGRPGGRSLDRTVRGLRRAEGLS